MTHTIRDAASTQERTGIPRAGVNVMSNWSNYVFHRCSQLLSGAFYSWASWRFRLRGLDAGGLAGRLPRLARHGSEGSGNSICGEISSEGGARGDGKDRLFRFPLLFWPGISGGFWECPWEPMCFHMDSSRIGCCSLRRVHLRHRALVPRHQSCLVFWQVAAGLPLWLASLWFFVIDDFRRQELSRPALCVRGFVLARSARCPASAEPGESFDHTLG